MWVFVPEGRPGYSALRFVTHTDMVAAARSNVAADMLRANTRTVLFDHTALSSSMNRADETSQARARSVSVY